MISRNNPYKILGVDPSASAEEIKAAYRELVKRYHPDRYLTYVQKAWATVKMQEINEAYSLLKDTVRRREYDRSRSTQPVSPETARRPSSTSPAPNHAPRSWYFRRAWVGIWGVISIIIFPFMLWSSLEEGELPTLVSILVAAYTSLAMPLVILGALVLLIGVSLFVVMSIISFGAILLIMLGSLVTVSLRDGFKKGLEHASEIQSRRIWLGLGVRVAVAVLAVALTFYFWDYRFGQASILSLFLLTLPGSLLPLGWILMTLGEVAALFVYIYRAKWINDTTDILLRS